MNLSAFCIQICTLETWHGHIIFITRIPIPWNMVFILKQGPVVSLGWWLTPAYCRDHCHYSWSRLHSVAHNSPSTVLCAGKYWLCCMYEYTGADMNVDLEVYTNIKFGHISDDIMTWKHFLQYWLFVRGNHQWLVDFGQRFDVSYAVNLNQLLKKKSSCWWFEIL